MLVVIPVSIVSVEYTSFLIQLRSSINLIKLYTAKLYILYIYDIRAVHRKGSALDFVLVLILYGKLLSKKAL